MKKFAATAALALLVLGAGTAHADLNLGVGVKAGTLGLGIEGRWSPLPYMDVRVGGNAYEYDETGSQAGVNYDAVLNLDNFYATANLRFPLSPFRVTAGAYSNGNELELVSADNATFFIGDDEYSAAGVGTLRSVTSFSSTSPYLGVGYDFSLFGKLGLNLDFGVLWQGEPEVTLTATGPLANDSTFMAELEKERAQLEDEMSDYKAWPVVSLGFFYNF